MYRSDSSRSVAWGVTDTLDASADQRCIGATPAGRGRSALREGRGPLQIGPERTNPRVAEIRGVVVPERRRSARTYGQGVTPWPEPTPKEWTYRQRYMTLEGQNLWYHLAAHRRCGSGFGSRLEFE